MTGHQKSAALSPSAVAEATRILNGAARRILAEQTTAADRQLEEKYSSSCRGESERWAAA